MFFVMLRGTLDIGHAINGDEYDYIETHGIETSVKNDEVMYLDIFGIGKIPKKVTKFIGDRNIISNIYRKQAHGWIRYE